MDALEGVTHALRTSEYRDREPQYNWVQDMMGTRKVGAGGVIGSTLLEPGRASGLHPGLHHRVPGTHKGGRGLGYTVHTWGGAG